MRLWVPKIFLVVLFVLAFTRTNAQKPAELDSMHLYPATVINGDTLANVLIREVVVFPQRKFATKKDYRNYRRLIHNLKVVYPYAQIAKYKIAEMDVIYSDLPNDKERKQYINVVEKELRNEFEDQLVKMTISQGRLLIKLIDREVGRTSYAVIRDLKGGFSAVFWQTIARIFGSSLKTEFDEAGDDKLLNELIILYEYGQL